MAFNFGLLRRWQKEKKFTQSRASRYIGISQSFYASLITGTKSPSFKTLEKICQRTGYSMNDFQVPDTEALNLKMQIESEKPRRKPRTARTA